MCQKNCATTVKNCLEHIDGVITASVSFPLSRAIVEYSNDYFKSYLEAYECCRFHVDEIGFDLQYIKHVTPTFCFRMSLISYPKGMLDSNNKSKDDKYNETEIFRLLNEVSGVVFASFNDDIANLNIWVKPNCSSNEHYLILEEVREVFRDQNVEVTLCDVDNNRNQEISRYANSVPFQETKDNVEGISHQKSEIIKVVGDRQIGSSSAMMVLEMDVSGMSCSSCVRSIETALSKTSGISSVRVALLMGKVEVLYDLNCFNNGANEILNIVNDLGYEAKLCILKQRNNICVRHFVYKLGYGFDRVCAIDSSRTNDVKALLNDMSGVCDVLLNDDNSLMFVSIEDNFSKVSPQAHYHDTNLRNNKVGGTFINRVSGPRDILSIFRSSSNGLSCEYLKEISDSTIHDHDDDIKSLLSNFHSIVGEDHESMSMHQHNEIKSWLSLLSISCLFGIPVIFLHLIMHLSPKLNQILANPTINFVCGDGVSYGQFIMLILNTILQILVGSKYYKSAALLASHGNFGMDFLVSIGIGITFIYSVLSLFESCVSGRKTAHTFFEVSGMLLLFVTFGKYLESYSKGSISTAIAELLKLRPQNARIVTNPEILSDLQSTSDNIGSITIQSSNTKNNGVTDDDCDTTYNNKLMVMGYGTMETCYGGNCPIYEKEEKKEDADDGERIIHIDKLANIGTEKVSIELVQRGDIIEIRPGIIIPVDGYIVQGESYVNESMITGESMPIRKKIGDFVFGSTKNVSNTFFVRTSVVSSESVLSQIISLVKVSQMDKAQVEQYADYIAGIFTPIVLSLSFLTFAIWVVLIYTAIAPRQWFVEDYDDPYLCAMLFAISVIVISCPCALGLATPTAIMAGTSKGTTLGILVKGGSVFETAYKLSSIVFDKTGTLTHGMPTVTDIIPVAPSPESDPMIERSANFDTFSTTAASPSTSLSTAPFRLSSTNNYSKTKGTIPSTKMEEIQEKILEIASLAEYQSNHPIAKAILEKMKGKESLIDEILRNDNGKHIARDSIVGKGVICQLIGLQQGSSKLFSVDNFFHKDENMKAKGDENCSERNNLNVSIHVGNIKLMNEAKIKIDSTTKSKVSENEIQGKTVVYVALNLQLIGLIAVCDSLRDNVKNCIDTLKNNMNIDVWVVTGDNLNATLSITKQLNIPRDRVVASALPNDKVDIIKYIKNSAHKNVMVGMVGDGINDSPALTEADVGFAIGIGDCIAIDAADIVLVRNNLIDVIHAIDLAKHVFYRVKLNFLWAIIYNILAIPFAAGLWYPWTHMLVPPQYAGLSMALSSLSIVISSASITFYKPNNNNNNNNNISNGVSKHRQSHGYLKESFPSTIPRIIEFWLIEPVKMIYQRIKSLTIRTSSNVDGHSNESGRSEYMRQTWMQPALGEDMALLDDDTEGESKDGELMPIECL